jgi:hypothetical protein
MRICDVYAFTTLDQCDKKRHHVHVCMSNYNKKLQHYILVMENNNNDDNNNN